MKELLIKTLVSVIILSLLVTISLYFVFTRLENKLTMREESLINKGLFSEMQARLSNHSPSQWQTILNKIKNSPNIVMNTVKIKTLALSNQKMKQLMQGKIVLQSYPDKSFLYYTLERVIDYQRIGQSDSALAIEPSFKINDLLSHVTALMARLINLRLSKIPQSQWTKELHHLHKQYGLSFSLEKLSRMGLSAEAHQQLKLNHVTYVLPHDRLIRTWFYETPDPNWVIKVGPVTYPWWAVHGLLVQLASFIFLAIFIVSFLTWLFSRNSRKIYTLTKQYSLGDFSGTVKLSRLSTLRGTVKNIIDMGNNLKQLIKSQHNMTRFVAHETRTPLCTMQLALERLNENEHLTEKEKTYINSIQEDIDDLNRLTTQFLIYSQNSTRELTLHFQTINLLDWLKESVKRFKAAKINIQLNIDMLSHNNQIECDPRLLKHALENLISNALKFAIKNIFITAEISESALLIHVDDDGQGIIESDREIIFHAFETLNQDGALGKHIGMGLMIARTIVEKHRGTLTVTQSPILKGSRFTIQCPLTQ